LKLVESEFNEEIIHALGSKYITWGEISQMALEMAPESTSKVILEPDDWTLYRYKVDKMERLFGLSFDATDEIRDHMRWNLDRARRSLAGEKLHSVTHEFSDA
jgi:hypothetical protein